MTASLEAIQKLRRDVRDAAIILSDREARFLVDTYYAIQEHRIEAQNQVRALTASEEPNAVLGWLFDQHKTLEGEIAKALGDYSASDPAGQWARSVTGIGPIIAAGFLAHIDINKAPTVGHIWRFAGLDPTVTWEKGEKRPWNAALKVLCWKAGESFVKVSGRAYVKAEAVNREGTEQVERAEEVEGASSTERASHVESTVSAERAEMSDGTVSAERAVSPEGTVQPERANSSESTTPPERVLLDAPADPLDLYAWTFVKRKLQEVERNEAGLFADQAAATLKAKKIAKTTDAYKAYSQGRLPAARIHARAKRYAVKLFLAHLHHVMYESAFSELPPKPYILTQPGHVHYIAPPGWPMD